MGALDDITDADRQEAIELGQLIEDAEPEWLREALHSVVGVLAHHTGTLVNQLREVIRYELAADEDDDLDEPDRPVTTVYLPGDAP